MSPSLYLDKPREVEHYDTAFTKIWVSSMDEDVDDMTPAVREVCASRDIGAIFRLLLDGGMTQRELAVLV